MKKILCLTLSMIFSACALLSFTIFADSEEFFITEETLPVLLSSFQALPSLENNSISVKWITQSESSLLGFHLYRSKINLLSHAIKITPVVILATNTAQEYGYSYTDNEVELNTNYFYWLQILESDHNNFFGPVGAKLSSQENDHDIEETLLGNKLFANYPNPFNPTTTISFSVEKPCQVSIDLFNLKGQFIKKIFNQFVHVPNIKHNTVWDGRDSQGKKVASGIYFAHIKAGAFTKTTKMLLTK